MTIESQLRIAAQIALLSEVSPSLRSVSLKVEEKELTVRAILSHSATEEDDESMNCVAGEIIAALDSDFTLQEEFIRSDECLAGHELPLLVFRRREQT